MNNKKAGILVLIFTLVIVAISVANLFMCLNPAEGLEVTQTNLYVGYGFVAVSIAIFVVCLIKVIKESKASKDDDDSYDDDDDDDDE